MKTIHTTLVRKMPQSEPALQPAVPVRLGGAQGQGAEGGAGQEQQKLKHNPQEISRFTGSARTYPGFRKFWRENVETAHTECSQYLYLVAALSKEVKKRISRVAKNPRQIWEQLDVLYGKPLMLGEMVMQDNYDHKSGGKDFMMRFSVLLDETKVLLREHNQIDWLTSKPFIKQLEDKLPQKEKEEWAIQMETFEGSRYERLQQFLYSQRMIYERIKVIGMKNALLSAKDGAEACSKERCRRKGHKMKNCPAKKSPQDHENIDLKPATVILDIDTSSLVHETLPLVHNESSGLICILVSDESLCLICPAYDPVYLRARLQPGLIENGRPRLLAEMLHGHQNAVRAYSLAEAHTQSLRCLGCVNCAPSQ